MFLQRFFNVESIFHNVDAKHSQYFNFMFLIY